MRSAGSCGTMEANAASAAGFTQASPERGGGPAVRRVGEVARQGVPGFTQIFGEFVGTGEFSCRGGRLCPPTKCSIFTEIHGKSATFTGPTESSAPTRHSPLNKAKLTEGIPQCSCKIQSAPRFAAFESPQALQASVPTPFGPTGPFPPDRGNRPLVPKGSLWMAADYRSTSTIQEAGNV